MPYHTPGHGLKMNKKPKKKKKTKPMRRGK